MTSSFWNPKSGTLRAFTLFEGVLMLVLGVLALVFPFMASVWVTTVEAKQLSRWLTFWRLVVSTVFVVAGVSMIQQLGAGPAGVVLPVASLSLAIGIVFLVEGAVASVVSLAHREISGWGWGLLNGLITLILGGLILSLPAASLLTVLGILVGISFLFSGIDLLSFSASFHPEDCTTQSSAGPFSAAEQSSMGSNPIEPVSWWSSILNSIPGSRPIRLV